MASFGQSQFNYPGAEVAQAPPAQASANANNQPQASRVGARTKLIRTHAAWATGVRR